MSILFINLYICFSHDRDTLLLLQSFSRPQMSTIDKTFQVDYENQIAVLVLTRSQVAAGPTIQVALTPYPCRHSWLQKVLYGFFFFFFLSQIFYFLNFLIIFIRCLRLKINYSIDITYNTNYMKSQSQFLKATVFFVSINIIFALLI